MFCKHATHVGIVKFLQLCMKKKKIQEMWVDNSKVAILRLQRLQPVTKTYVGTHPHRTTNQLSQQPAAQGV